jgi:hypothetical protein
MFGRRSEYAEGIDFEQQIAQGSGDQERMDAIGKKILE